ncbi:hypothetical protein Q8A73_001034 [Channa argus]|nr:hypothetical protein Q8A73_001034 [Channa argus]
MMDFAEKSIEPVLKNQPMDPVLTENKDKCLQRSTFPSKADPCDSLTRFNFALHQAKEREARGQGIKPKSFMFSDEVEHSQYKERFRLAIQVAKETEAKCQDTAGPGSTFKTKPADEKDKRQQKTHPNLEVTMTSKSSKHHPLETAISEVVDKFSADIQQTKYTKKQCEEILGSYRNIFKAHVEINSALEAFRSCVSSQKDKEDRDPGTDHLLKLLQGVKSMIENKNNELDLLITKISDVQKQHHIKLQEIKDIKQRLKDMRDYNRSVIQANMDLRAAVEDTEKYLSTRNTLAVVNETYVGEYRNVQKGNKEKIVKPRRRNHSDVWQQALAFHSEAENYRHTMTQAAEGTAPTTMCEDTQPTLDVVIETCVGEYSHVQMETTSEDRHTVTQAAEDTAPTTICEDTQPTLDVVIETCDGEYSHVQMETTYEDRHMVTEAAEDTAPTTICEDTQSTLSVVIETCIGEYSHVQMETTYEDRHMVKQTAEDTAPTNMFWDTQPTLDVVIETCVDEYSHVQMETFEDRHMVSEAAKDTASTTIYEDTQPTLDVVMETCIDKFSHVQRETTTNDKHRVTRAAENIAPTTIYKNNKPTLDEVIEKCVRERPEKATLSCEEFILQENGCIEHSRKQGGQVDFSEELQLAEERLDDQPGFDREKKKSLWRKLFNFPRKKVS